MRAFGFPLVVAAFLACSSVPSPREPDRSHVSADENAVGPHELELPELNMDLEPLLDDQVVWVLRTNPTALIPADIRENRHLAAQTPDAARDSRARLEVAVDRRLDLVVAVDRRLDSRQMLEELSASLGNPESFGLHFVYVGTNEFLHALSVTLLRSESAPRQSLDLRVVLEARGATITGSGGRLALGCTGLAEDSDQNPSLAPLADGRFDAVGFTACLRHIKSMFHDETLITIRPERGVDVHTLLLATVTAIGTEGELFHDVVFELP
jgi:hypothetical protein